MEKVTACLITWKRQYNLPKIIENLSKWPFIDEIIIRDNSKGENVINFGRYISAYSANNRAIYVQDDDYVVNDLDKLYEEFLKHPKGITHTGNSSYEADIPNNIYGERQMALVGWGAFMHTYDLGCLSKYRDKFGDDYCFYRETDRILSILMDCHHPFLRCNITELPGKNDEFALCNQEDHLKYKKLAIERALALL